MRSYSFIPTQKHGLIIPLLLVILFYTFSSVLHIHINTLLLSFQISLRACKSSQTRRAVAPTVLNGSGGQ